MVVSIRNELTFLSRQAGDSLLQGGDILQAPVAEPHVDIKFKFKSLQALHQFLTGSEPLSSEVACAGIIHC